MIVTAESQTLAREMRGQALVLKVDTRLRGTRLRY